MSKGVYERKTVSIAERFWRHVEKTDGCWGWRGSTWRFGYGLLWGGRENDTNLLAHRVSWEIHFGQIPDGLCVLHKCDNPPCSRPEHLFLGTKADNNLDRDAKGRTVTPPRRAAETYNRGEAHHNSILTEAQVAEIKTASGSYRDIGKQFGVSTTTVRLIKIGRTWRHVA